MLTRKTKKVKMLNIPAKNQYVNIGIVSCWTAVQYTLTEALQYSKSRFVFLCYFAQDADVILSLLK